MDFSASDSGWKAVLNVSPKRKAPRSNRGRCASGELRTSRCGVRFILHPYRLGYENTVPLWLYTVCSGLSSPGSGQSLQGIYNN